MLTDTAIKNAIAKGKARELKDGTGRGTGRLVLRIRTAKGRVIAEWYARQWLNGKRRTIKIGTYPNTPLAVARQRFVEEFSPAIERREDVRRHKRTKKGTLKELFDGYVANLKREGATSWEDVEYCLGRALKSLDGEAPANAVKVDDVVALLRPIYTSGSKAMTKKIRGMVSAAFGWGVRSENDYRVPDANKVFGLGANPVAATPTDPIAPRERWLEVAEFRAYWQWLNGPATERRGKSSRYIEPTNLAVLKFSALTGQRIVEICRINEAMYNKARVFVEWPPRATKTGRKTHRGHVLPLPPQAVEILEATTPNEYGFYFPSQKYPDQHANPATALSIMHRYIDEAGADSFLLRDVRRTWKTLAAFAKISKDDRDRLQNHALGDVSSVHYDQYKYLDEKRAAMERWSRWFAENIENEPAPKVVNFRQ